MNDIDLSLPKNDLVHPDNKIKLANYFKGSIEQRKADREKERQEKIKRTEDKWALKAKKYADTVASRERKRAQNIVKSRAREENFKKRVNRGSGADHGILCAYCANKI